jgi:hypothetical protein
MTRIWLATMAVGVVFVAAACTTASSTTTVDRATTTVAVPEPAVLIVGEPAGGVAVVNEDGTVTERFDPPEGARYSQPIWASPDTIVYAQVAAGNSRLEAIRIGGGIVWSVGLDTPPFYYLASPDSERTTVVSLRNKAAAPGLVIEQISSKDRPRTVSEEAPFYASWHPDDGRLASHIGDSRIDITDATSETIDTDASGFQAPIWLASGLVTLRTDGSDSYLTRWGEDSFTNIAKVRGSARFVGASNSLAIVTGGDIETGGIQASAQAIPTISSGVLTVIDLEEGSFTSVTSDPSPMFQWDPAGEQLLYATFVDDPIPALVWHVWKDGEVTDFEPFVPEPSWFGTVAPFFDQYAQSISLWSPDGSAFAYPALVDGEARILVQPVEEANPLDIAAGNWVAWST